ncbi:MAG: SusC/RagA family TonB-linked outer membrane protein [Marinilabiliaceae bacterium]|nr:SusC/RagA family TonB-linked outer membrane protein [Marinilabiliaceae bacterium]
MRLTLLLMIIGLMQVTASSYSQNTRFRITEQDIQLEKLFEQIEKNSEYKFFYNNDEVDVSVQIDVAASNEDVFQVLEKAFAGLSYTYKVLDNNLIFVHRTNVGAEQRTGSAMQTHTVTGKVTDDKGEPLPGVNVFEKSNPTNGVITSIDGSYSIELSGADAVVSFSFIGFTSQEINVAGRTEIQITLVPEDTDLDEVIVTALGIKREEKSLGYAITKVDGEELTKVKSANITSALSGRTPGVNIISSGNLGGSSNVVIRGGSSITGDNQALYIVDGVPISNRCVVGRETSRGAGGYDYGNAASDINPEDIETISVLKGGAATAIYGSRGANGVILITTKSGKTTDRIGVSISSSVSFDKVNKATLPNYQTEYGGGANWKTHMADGDHGWAIFKDGFRVRNIDGEDYQVIDYGTDESWGPKFNDQMVLHWDSFDPSDPDRYLKPRPYKAYANPEKYFETGVLWVNSVALDGASDKGNFRVAFTNLDQNGTLPNDKLERNTLAFNGSLNLNEKLRTSVNASYTKTYTRNRPGTGYDEGNRTSFMASTAMWMQTSVNYADLENYKRSDTGEQKTWNRTSYNNSTPVYWDNPYWTVYENYPEDTRNRITGAWSVAYDITPWLTAQGQLTIDHSDFKIESRVAHGSWQKDANYAKDIRLETENNKSLNFNFNKQINEDLHLMGMIGMSRRDNSYEVDGFSTVAGLTIEDYYSVNNSTSPEKATTDYEEKTRVNSVYGTASIGFKNTYYLDLTARNDWSSTLPENNNSYFYPSVSGSVIFSNLIDVDAISFGKVRASWAQVGRDADFAQLNDPYYIYKRSFGNVARYKLGTWKRNDNLKPEIATTFEIGLAMKFLNNRIGLDLAVYDKVSKNQIIPGTVSLATGYYKQYMNAGEKTNKGIELAIMATPVKTENFKWDLNLNWSKDVSKVVKLAPGIPTHVINSYDVEVAAVEGEQYGALIGTDYEYTSDGVVINSDGQYAQAKGRHIIGNITPDWRGGITNTFTYKNWSLNTLIDIKMGGDLYSRTYHWGMASGILEETVVRNELGNSVRDDINYDDDGNLMPNSGGIVLDGVVVTTRDADGNATAWEPNTKRISGYNYGAQWDRPNKASIFDASYVKLREVALNYNLPKSLINRWGIGNVQVSIIGRNLAILHRNYKHADPEQTYGAGNVQGLDIGSMPTTRSVGASVKLNF